MVSQKTLLSCLALFLIFLISNYSPTADAKIPENVHSSLRKKPRHEPYKFAKEFCNKRISKEGRDFCTRVLATNPRSATVKSYVDLLYISIDIGVRYLNVTKGYIKSLLHNNATKREFRPALKHCLRSNYNTSVIELLGITEELKDDPAMASYDAHMALDELEYCENALKSHKFADDSFWSKHEIAKASVILCEHIANCV